MVIWRILCLPLGSVKQHQCTWLTSHSSKRQLYMLQMYCNSEMMSVLKMPSSWSLSFQPGILCCSKQLAVRNRSCPAQFQLCLGHILHSQLHWCMCVCDVWMCVCGMCTSACDVCMCVYARVCDVCMCVYVYVVCVCVCKWCVYMCIWLCVCIWYVCVCVHIHINVVMMLWCVPNSVHIHCDVGHTPSI